jgi:Flp pilus assembly protein TadB
MEDFLLSSRSPSEEERAARIRQARQVLSGNQVQAPRHPLDFGRSDGLINPAQRLYLMVLGGLLILALVLYFIWGLGIASPVLALMALVLLAGWVIF